MGHGQSKGNSKPTANDERGIRLHCQMESSMALSLTVPDYIAERYCLRFEKYVRLIDSRTAAKFNPVYCCEVSQDGGRIYLNRGWAEFVEKTGAAVGNFMFFDIRGAGETFVWVFSDKKDPTVSAGCGSSVAAESETAGGAVDADMQKSLPAGSADAQEEQGVVEASVSEGGRKQVPELVDDEDKHTNTAIDGGISSSGTYSTTSDSSSPWTTSTEEMEAVPGSDENMSNALEPWHEKLVIGKDVQLEDRMVEFIAAGLDWELPDYGIYVGKVEATSIAHNRLRLPKLFTSENVMPLLQGKEKTFYLASEREGDKQLKFSIGKDGRAALTVGWKDFANANGIRPGSLLAIGFSDKQTELDISIDLLRE